MFKPTAPLAILALLLTPACDRSDAPVTATAPLSLQAETSPFGTAPLARIRPSAVTAQLIGHAVCPELHPFLVTANLVLHSHDGGSMFLREVRMRFIDSAGIPGPQVTLPAPLPIRQFGTALTDARGDQMFPLDFRFGCGTRRTGTIIVIVHARDKHGLDHNGEIRLSVR